MTKEELIDILKKKGFEGIYNHNCSEIKSIIHEISYDEIIELIVYLRHNDIRIELLYTGDVPCDIELFEKDGILYKNLTEQKLDEIFSICENIKKEIDRIEQIINE